jgi:hypothetical protein
MANPTVSKDQKNNTQKKSAPVSEVWEKGSEVKETKSPAAPDPEPAPEAEPAPAAPAAAPAARKPRKKGQRTPLATRLAAAPTAARKAIIIEEQLKMVDRRRKSILGLVGQDVLDNVDPSLLS